MRFRQFVTRYRAILFITGLTTAAVIGTVAIFNISNKSSLKFIEKYVVARACREFECVEKNHIKLFSAAVEALKSNREIGSLFARRDREQLYRFTFPIFENLKKESNITHWYFLNPEPEKTCFLRVHAYHKYNDTITRITLDECIKSKRFASGKELGKTAFALRLVHPFYFDNRLIGYIELGMEIEILLEVMKNLTGHEYGLLVLKEFLDKEKWESVIKGKGTRNNWDDMEKLLLVSKTSADVGLIDFAGDIKTVPAEGLVLQRIKRDEKMFIRGIFPLYDAAAKKVGGVFILREITPIYTGMQAQKNTIITVLIIFMTVITFFMVFLHTRAERELRKYRFNLEEMIRERTAELRRTNESLNRKIEQYEITEKALKREWKARVEAEKKQVAAVKLAERSTRLASIGVMAAGITHEINQPLNAIKVTADSIRYWHKQNPGALPRMFTEQLDNISKSVDRITEIVRHMRAFWVIPDNPEISIVNLNLAVKNTLSLVDRQLSSHGIVYEFVSEEDHLYIKSNRVHLEQIVINLVVNAMHSLDEITIKDKRIDIRTVSEKGFAVLKITDNGIGLPVKGKARLFDPFYSTKKAGEGTGLGLAIVKNYIDRYKGTITAKNNKGRGATFILKFPLCEQEQRGGVP